MLEGVTVPPQVYYPVVLLFSYLPASFFLFVLLQSIFPVSKATFFRGPVITHQFTSLKETHVQSIPTCSRW